MKLFQITFTFKDPTTAMGTFAANSEEEAVNNLKAQLEGQVEDLVITEIEELEAEFEPEQIAATENTTIN